MKEGVTALETGYLLDDLKVSIVEEMVTTDLLQVLKSFFFFFAHTVPNQHPCNHVH